MCVSLPASVHQDSLLEITLRSRVIEKLSVALHDCLFAGQEGDEELEQRLQATHPEQNVLFIEAREALATGIRCNICVRYDAT